MKPTRPWAILLVLCLGTFAILLDTTIVNVALPSLITNPVSYTHLRAHET